MRRPTADDKLMLRLILAGESLSEVSRIMHLKPADVLWRLKDLMAEMVLDDGPDHKDGSSAPLQ